MSDAYEVSAKITGDASPMLSALQSVTDGLDQWGANLEQVSGEGTEAFAQLSVGAASFGDATAGANVEVGELKGGLGELFDAGKAFDDVLMDMASQFAIAAVAMKAVEAIADGFNDGLTKTMQLENAVITMTAFTGSTQLAQQALEGIEALEKSTPFAFPDLYAAERTLLAMGMSTSDVTDAMGMLTDVAAGLGIPIQNLAESYARIENLGVASSREITQMAREGIPIWQELSVQTGLTGEALKQYVATGAVTFAMVQKAFEDMTGAGGKFYQMAQMQEDTLKGSQDQLNKATEDYFAKIAEGISGPMKTWNQALATILNSFTNFSSNYKKEQEGITEALESTWAQMDAKGKAYLEAHKTAVKSDSDNTKSLALESKDYLDKLGEELETDEVKRLQDEEQDRIDEVNKAKISAAAKAEAIAEIQASYASKINAAVQTQIDKETEYRYAHDATYQALIKDSEAAKKADEDAAKAREAQDKENAAADKSFDAMIAKQHDETNQRIKAGWTGVFEEISAGNENMGTVAASVLTGMKSSFSSAFTEIGGDVAQSLEGQGASWSNLKKIGLDALAAIVRALGEMLMADAVKDASDMNYGQAGLDLAGAAAAFVAAGAIPAFAVGTSYAGGGAALVGERGPELVNLPQGSSVSTAGDTAGMLGGGDTHIHLHSPAVANPSQHGAMLRRVAQDLRFKGILR